MSADYVGLPGHPAASSRATPGGQVKAELAKSRQTSARRAYALLRSEIRSGRLAPDSQLSEDNLVRSLMTSRGAVREALQMLSREGLVDRRPRVGTRVRHSIVSMRSDVTLSVSGQFGDDRIEMDRVEQAYVLAPPMVGDLLGIPPGGNAAVMEWDIRLDGEPLCVRTAYVAGEPAFITEEDKVADLRSTFRRLFGVDLGVTRTTLTASIADAKLAERLGISTGDPVITAEIEQDDVDGQCRGIAFSHYRADRTSFMALTDDGHDPLRAGPA